MVPFFLDRLDGVRQTRRGWRACAPCHGGTTSGTLSIIPGNVAWIVKCFKGCSKDRICKALGIAMQQLWYDWQEKQGGKTVTRGRVVERYAYCQPDGELVYEVERVEPGRNGRKKDFYQRRPMPDGTWAYSLEGGRFGRRDGKWRSLGQAEDMKPGDVELPPVVRLLYKLPEMTDLFEAGRDPLVFVTEGERKTDRLWQIGVCATSCSGGAEKWQTSFSKTLTGRRVVLLPDNDERGWEHMALVAGSLLLWRVASVRILHLPGLAEKGDVVDFLRAFPPRAAAFEKRTALLRLARATEEFRRMVA